MGETAAFKAGDRSGLWSAPSELSPSRQSDRVPAQLRSSRVGAADYRPVWLHLKAAHLPRKRDNGIASGSLIETWLDETEPVITPGPFTTRAGTSRASI
jgi:hypothetical protein